MSDAPFTDFQFWDALRVRVCGRVSCGAAKRFATKFANYRVTSATEATEPDLLFDLQPFDANDPHAYIFNQYRIAPGRLGKTHQYKIAKWRSRIEGLDGKQWHARVWGNASAQGVIPHQTMTSLVQLQLELRGWSSVHAAAVDRDGRGTVIAGRRGVGKTTLIGRLLKARWAMVSEDRVFMRDGTVQALRVPVNLKYDRSDPRLIRLPFASRARMLRNRLLAIATGGYFTLHEPVDLLRWLPQEQVRESTRLNRFIYLQSGPHMHVEKNADPRELARRVVLGNRFEDPTLSEDLLAYQFCFPNGREDLNSYWDAAATRLTQQLENCDRSLVTVPIAPTQDQWRRLEDEVAH